MKMLSNECGSRNGFGFYDTRAREIVLTRPCTRKSDINEVYFWLDEATDLQKLSIGIGGAENFVADHTSGGLYTAARSTIRQSVIQNAAADNEILKNILLKLQDKKDLRNLALRCFMFSEDFYVFDLFLSVIKELPSLVYLDLTGCYFTDDQLIDLARTLSNTHIASLVWPEPRMSQLVLDQVVRGLSASRSLVVVQCVPAEIEKIAANNRQWAFNMAKHPSLLKENEIALMKEYKNTFLFAIAYEKQCLLELEKTITSVVA
ncbi:MAG: hypothetical protein NC218_06815 [Acetobacter sp.]|nr:hypothetical protein [Acetobacter sp.]